MADYAWLVKYRIRTQLSINEASSLRENVKSQTADINQDIVTSLVSHCALIISCNVLSHFCSFLRSFLFFFFLSSLLSEITYNICQRSDTAPLPSRCSNPLEKCPLYYLSEAIYRTLSCLLLFPFVFRLSLRLHPTPPLLTHYVVSRFRPGLNV